jgi:hypothetical protein
LINTCLYCVPRTEKVQRGKDKVTKMPNHPRQGIARDGEQSLTVANRRQCAVVLAALRTTSRAQSYSSMAVHLVGMHAFL